MENAVANNQDEIILSRVFSLLGFDGIQMIPFSNRLRYQKLVYLAQNLGLGLGYGYSWYVRGPYSPALTRTLFNIKQQPPLFEQGKTTTFKHEKEIVQKLDTLKEILGNNFENAYYLEVLASLHYLHTTLPSGENDCSHIKQRLIKIKPDLKNVENIESMMDLACKQMKHFT